jgi:hypothetical protein
MCGHVRMLIMMICLVSDDVTTRRAQLMTGGLGPTSAQYPYGYNQGMGYWYPGAYPQQMQSQFVQGMQGYATYGQFGYQPG